MNRREFLGLTTTGSLLGAPAALLSEEPELKITGVRVVQAQPKRPMPTYQPAAGSWSTTGSEVASPMSIYAKYKAQRALFMPDPGKLPSFWVEISTNKGLKGYGQGGTAGGYIVEQHLAKLLIGENPLDIERLWDIMWRSTLYYGRKGAVLHAISGVDLALWDLMGKAAGWPVYRLLGGLTKERVPAYCTGNDLEHHVAFGFKRLKLAMPHGPADGREGQRKNLELVRRARELLGPDGDIMLDCWMAWNERYTLEMAELVEPYRVYWMEEVLPPDDYAGMGRLRRLITSTRLATGEHEYTRYGFRLLLEHDAAEIWQPDIHWCGGLTELRRIAALAASYDIPVIPHAGGTRDAIHFIAATPNAPWAELFMPAPGGPEVVYRQYEEDNCISRGPEGIYTQPFSEPGFGWERLYAFT